jgi:hypothetical protein
MYRKGPDFPSFLGEKAIASAFNGAWSSYENIPASTA